jgi:predicted regulator of Ras-like GTPase activity (Roadblock/LC7/MglB family)
MEEHKPTPSKLLGDLEKLGVLHAVLTGKDGLVIESVGPGGPQAEYLAAEIAALSRRLHTLTPLLEQPIRRLAALNESRELLAVFEGDYCIGAIVARGSDRRAISRELSRLAHKLVQLP